jgi:quercetin dioxygenase-like cupin family protein/alkylhydroperoxidase/carboxymuconolactone decarboxylase family protein YurZ
LDAKQESIAQISALTAVGDLDDLRGALEGGLEAGLTVNQIKEVLVQLYAYCGFPRSLQGINTFMSVLEAREERGIEDEMGPEPTSLSAQVDKYEKGKEVLAKLSGEPQDGPKTGFAAFSPAIDRYLKEHLFADIFAADIISYSDREVATIAALASMRGVEPMLNFHLNAGMNVGLDQADLEHIIAVVGSSVSQERAETGKTVLANVLESRDEPSQDNQQQGSTDASQKAPAEIQDTIFPRGKKVTEGNFTGDVWLQMFVDDGETYDARTGKVTFPAGSRTDWHSHPGGQILLVTGGKGYNQPKNGPRETLRPGDVVATPPGQVHWHGAAPDSEFSHIFIVTNQEKGRVQWLEPVTDEEYAE